MTIGAEPKDYGLALVNSGHVFAWCRGGQEQRRIGRGGQRPMDDAAGGDAILLGQATVTSEA